MQGGASSAKQGSAEPASSEVTRGRTANGWRGELAGALSATVAMLPFVLSYGFILYGALGSAAVQVGLTASVIAVVLGAADGRRAPLKGIITAAPSTTAITDAVSPTCTAALPSAPYRMKP